MIIPGVHPRLCPLPPATGWYRTFINPSAAVAAAVSRGPAGPVPTDAPGLLSAGWVVSASAVAARAGCALVIRAEGLPRLCG